MTHEQILVIGASGQIGSELVLALRDFYGSSNVIAADIREHTNGLPDDGPFELLDVLDPQAIGKVLSKYQIKEIYHLAALLSAVSEQKPALAWNINMNGLFNVLDAAREKKISKIFWPSSIAVFGPTTPKVKTEQSAITEPTTVYGISKLAGERWCAYYHEQYGMDIRSLRYPGLISYKTAPGGGTTDFAVEIFIDAINKGSYDCFIAADTELPMMYMDDAIRGTLELMQADTESITIRSSYNFNAFSFTPQNLADEIKKSLPDFSIGYTPDYRQELAATWPHSIDDRVARDDWGWDASYEISGMTLEMLQNLQSKITSQV